MKKKFKYDGRSRPSTDLYKKNFEIISFKEAFYLIDNKKKIDKK